MSFTSLEKQLDLLEQQFNEVSSALIDGDPVLVESSSAALQQLAVDFLQIADELGRGSLAPAHLALRVKTLAVGLPTLHANLLRRSFYVDRALQLVVPATQAPTYSAASTNPYGNGVRQSGQFKVMSA
jgi:hypothetical protein